MEVLDALTVLEPILQHHLRCGARRWLLSAAAYCIRPLAETDHAELAAVVLGAVIGELDAHPQPAAPRYLSTKRYCYGT
jgi:hypothetical protein